MRVVAIDGPELTLAGRSQRTMRVSKQPSPNVPFDRADKYVEGIEEERGEDDS